MVPFIKRVVVFHLPNVPDIVPVFSSVCVFQCCAHLVLVLVLLQLWSICDKHFFSFPSHNNCINCHRPY